MTENKVKVKDLKPGMRVNVYGDPFADPDKNHPADEFQLRVVAGIELETPACVRVDFEEDPSVGFPPDHEILVDEEVKHDGK